MLLRTHMQALEEINREPSKVRALEFELLLNPILGLPGNTHLMMSLIPRDSAALTT